MPNSGRVVKAKEGAKWRYRVELSISDAIDAGCWFTFASQPGDDENEAYLIWHNKVNAMIGEDTQAKTPPSGDTVWMEATEKEWPAREEGDKPKPYLCLKFKNAQPIQPGRHVAFISERESRFEGTYLSGALNPDNPQQQGNTLTGEEIAEALALGIDPATLPGATVEPEPIATPATVEDRKVMLLAKLARLKQAGEAAEEAKALFPEVSLAGKHPDSTDLPH